MKNKTILLSFVLALLSSTVMAVTYDISVKLSSNGKPITDGRFIINEDQEAVLSKDENFIELVATPNSRGVAMTIVSGVMTDEGDRTIVTKAELVVAKNKTTVVTLGKLTNPSEKITLSVYPKIVTTKN